MAEFARQIASDYIVLDLETTGLSPAHENIIEIAALKVINDEIVDSYSTLVDPHHHISNEITMLTGIDDRMVSGAPDIKEAMDGFVRFAGDMPLLGHNLIRFDMKFLEMQKHFDNYCIDTLYMADHMNIGSRSCSLTALCEHFGVVNSNAHRALSDCKATYEIYKCLKKLYSSIGAYFTMSVSCGLKKHQANVKNFCKEGTILTAEPFSEDKLMIYADGQSIGTVSGGKLKEYNENRSIIKNISVDTIKINAKGKYLLSAIVNI